MKEINQRIKELRDELGLTLRAFADKIGYTHGTIASVEHGNATVERRLIVVVCSVFKVNEEWLVDGKGGMFRPVESMPEDDILEILKDKYQLSERTLDLVRGYFALTEENRAKLVELVHLLAQSTETDKKNASAPVRTGESSPDTQDFSKNLRKLA